MATIINFSNQLLYALPVTKLVKTSRVVFGLVERRENNGGEAFALFPSIILKYFHQWIGFVFKRHHALVENCGSQSWRYSSQMRNSFLQNKLVKTWFSLVKTASVLQGDIYPLYSSLLASFCLIYALATLR